MDFIMIMNLIVGLWLTGLGVVWFKERNSRPNAMKWVALNWTFAVANFGCVWWRFALEGGGIV